MEQSTIRFLKGLKKNNNKPWFDKNRNAYEDARDDFAAFIQQVIDQHSKKDNSLKDLRAKDCLFRIFRDIRFSKDKSPYKSNFGASINPKGRKAMDAAGYYFHLEPGNSFAGGGLYHPMPDLLKKVRQEIDYNWDDFRKIIVSKKFLLVYDGLDKSEEFLLSRIPKGYEPDHPAGEYLKLKSYIAITSLRDSELTSKALLSKTLSAFEALQPLLSFLNKSIEG